MVGRHACWDVGLGMEKVPRGTSVGLHLCGRVVPPLRTKVASFSGSGVLDGTLLASTAGLVAVLVAVRMV